MTKLLSLTTLALWALSTAATGVTIPGATVEFGNNVGGTSYRGPFLPGPFPGVDTFGASVTLSFGYLDGSASASLVADAHPGAPSGDDGGYGIVDYYFEVVGPSSVVVPLVFGAVGNVSTSVAGSPFSGNDVSASAGVGGVASLNGNFVELAGSAIYIDTVYAGSASESFNTPQEFPIVSNTIGDVEFRVSGSAQIGNCPGCAASISASVDPAVTFDPSFSLPGYSLIFSANPSTSIPEPTMPMLVFAALASVAVVRSHRRSSTRK